MNPHEALSRVEQIREQLARAEVFRVYRAASTGFTGLLAFSGGLVQKQWGLDDPISFLVLWLLIAAISIFVVAMEMAVRYLWSESVLLRDATIVAARQFIPCVTAGGLLTIVLYRFVPQAVGLLPGLWAAVFSLGVFASRVGLPPAINLVGAWYLLSGLVVIAISGREQHFVSWAMPLCFGVGQLLTAAILYFCTERRHGE